MEELTGFQPMKAPFFQEHEQLKCPRCDSDNTKFCYYNNYNLSQPRHFCKNCRRYWTKGGVLRNIPVGGGARKNNKRSSSSSNNSNQPKRQLNSATEPTSNQKLPEPSPPQPPTSSTIPQHDLLSLSVQNSVPVVDQTRMYVSSINHQERNRMDNGGSFSSFLASSGQLGNLLKGSVSETPGVDNFRVNLELGRGVDTGTDRDPRLGNSNDSRKEAEVRYLVIREGGDGGGDTSCCTGGGHGWPDLAIYTPGSSFH